MKTKHTPTPWERTPKGIAIYDDRGSIICRGFDEDIGYLPEAEANANHIVKCVNMHDAVLTLLHDALLELTGEDDEQSELVFRIKDVLEKANQ